jgi:hypothetical protein
MRHDRRGDSTNPDRSARPSGHTAEVALDDRQRVALGVRRVGIRMRSAGCSRRRSLVTRPSARPRHHQRVVHVELRTLGVRRRCDGGCDKLVARTAAASHRRSHSRTGVRARPRWLPSWWRRSGCPSDHIVSTTAVATAGGACGRSSTQRRYSPRAGATCSGAPRCGSASGPCGRGPCYRKSPSSPWALLLQQPSSTGCPAPGRARGRRGARLLQGPVVAGCPR